MPAARAVDLAAHPAWRVFSTAWRTTGDALGDMIFPWRCVLCNASYPGLRSPFCAPCRSDLLALAVRNQKSSCPRCALPVGPYADLDGGCSKCRGRSLGFDAALTLGHHEEPWRGFCLRLKRERGAWIAPWLGELFVEARQAEMALLPADAWIVPIPQHWLRRLKKGYNQAEALAWGLALPLHRDVRRAIRRVKSTHHLVGLDPKARAEALRGAFDARRGSRLKGKTVLLVDDVLTTGATLGAAARALKRAGASRVVVAVLSRAL